MGKTLANKTFSFDDVTETFIECSEHFDELDNPKPKGEDTGKTKQKGYMKNPDPEIHSHKQCLLEHHGVMFMYKQEIDKKTKMIQLNQWLASSNLL